MTGHGCQPSRREVLKSGLAVLASAGISAGSAVARSGPEPVVFLAAQSGKPTYDEAEGGGNPFASALIELLGKDGTTFEAFAAELARLTKAKSGGRQVVDRKGAARASVSPSAAGWQSGRRVGLVIVNSDYSRSGGAQMLPGARHDADRVANAMSRAGFATRTVIDARLADFKSALSEFQKQSRRADLALIYTTGHGVEVDGAVHLLMGDYPVAKGAAALPSHAVRLSAIAEAADANRANFVFYGGCRENPFK